MFKNLKISTKLTLVFFLGSLFPTMSIVFLLYKEISYILITENIDEQKIYGIFIKSSELLLLETSFIIIIFILFWKSIVNPIEKLKKGIERIKKGEFNYKIGTNLKNEVGVLGKDLEELALSIKESQKETTKKIEKQNNELKEKKQDLENEQKAILNVLEDMEEEKMKVTIEQKKLKVILESIGDGLCVLDKKRKIILTNPVTEKLTGFTQKEMKDKKYEEILHFVSEKDETIKRFGYIKEVYEKGISSEIESDSILIQKHKTKIPIDASAAPLKNKKGEIIGCVVVFRDVSKEREINRMKSEFVSVASHQLRTPLTSINWYIEILLSEDIGQLNKDQKEYLHNVYSGSQRMAELVNELLNVSRIENQQLKINWEHMDFQKVIQSVVKECLPIANIKNIKIINPEKKEKYEGEADPNLIRQVIHNVVVNAIKYSYSQSQVKINLEKNKEGVLLKIEDHGIGIPQKFQSHIFEKFYRAPNATSKETDGTGLGLYIAKMLIEAHKGKIWFTSKEKKTTIFEIYLPFSKNRKK